MFCIYYQVHGSSDIQEKFFRKKVNLDEWVKQHQEFFSFCKIHKENIQ